METSNVLKFDSYPHAKAALESTNSYTVEATSNVFWGLGLPPDLMRSTLADYWPGENQFGKILMKIKSRLSLEDAENSGDKWKASSPLVNNPKIVCQ